MSDNIHDQLDRQRLPSFSALLGGGRPCPDLTVRAASVWFAVGSCRSSGHVVEFRLFGGVQLVCGGRLLDVGTPRQQAVLAALAVDVGRPVAIETLIDRVWCDTPPAEVRSVLYSHLSRIRQLLRQVTEMSGAVARIDRRNAGYVLDVDPGVVDLRRFARLIEEGIDSRGSDADRAAALTEALDLWRGPPLAGISGDWADQVRGSWHRRRLDAVVRWGELELKLGRASVVISTMPDLAAEYPLAEPLESLLMRALHMAGRNAEAIERFAVIRKRLADELGADPGPQLSALHAAILRGGLPVPDRGGSSSIEPVPAPPPVSRQASISGTPFPVRRTSFIGRVAELRDVRSMLDRHRLVTLVGPGGAGKTRLALEAARAWTEGSHWYVDLAPLDDGEAVVAALAVATGAPEGPGEDPLTATARRIGDTTGLFLVDNCDQVIDTCARAVDVLLSSCPALTVLATSREPLRVEGEVGVRVPPLSLPAGEGVDGDAVRLFLDRARLTAEGDPRDRAGIREICRRLDGMPLAIELAAARAAALSVSDIVTGLTDRFGLLADGPRTADRRQRSLAASIQWSFRLLTEAETIALQRLAAFRSPFTAEAAIAVVTGERVDESEVLSLLARLVEKSFVVIDERHHIARYRLLETIREYAAARLAGMPSDARATRDRHLRYLRETAERLEPIFRRQPPPQWVHRFESELPDIRAAVSWAAETGNADDALRLIGALSRFWWVRARADGGRVIKQALAIDGGDPRWRAHALTAATIAALARYDPVALEFGNAAVRWAEDSHDPGMAARAHCWLGWADLYLDLEQAPTHLDRAHELARDADDRWTLATVLNGLAAAELGHSLPSAKAKAQEALALAVSLDNRVETCSAHLSLGTITLVQGRLAEANNQARMALSLAESMEDLVWAGESLTILAQCAVMRGAESAAREHLDALAAAAKASANPVLEGYATAIEALINLTRDRDEQARQLLAQTLPAVSFFPKGIYAAWMADVLTDAALEANQPDEARIHAAVASRIAEDADNDWARTRARLAAARVNAHTGEIQSARQHVHHALEHAGHNDDLMTTIEALELLARLDVQTHPDIAVRLAAATAATRAHIEYVRPLTGAASMHLLRTQFRSQMSDHVYHQAWSEGAGLPLDEAVALARRDRRLHRVRD